MSRRAVSLVFALLFGVSACGESETSSEVAPVTCCTDSQCEGEAGPLDACQRAVCDEDSCECGVVALPAGAACEDGDECTSGDTCQMGRCTSGVSVCDCAVDADCAAAEDGDLCNGTLVCDTDVFPSRCVLDPATVVACEPSGDPCLRAQCDPGNGECGLVAGPDGTPCEDGDECTSGDTCQEGLCQGGESVCECDNDQDCAEAEDGDLCNGTLVCNTARFPHRCEVDPQTVVTCDTQGDGPCQRTECEPTSGACQRVDAQDGTRCEDGEPCTSGDTCEQGACVAGRGVCDCAVDADCAAAEDGDLCNGTLVCNTARFPHRCEVDPQTVVTCDRQGDGPCAQSLCQPETGQCAPVPSPEGVSCDADADGCTVGDRCDGQGVCQPGGVADCSFLDGSCLQGLCASVDALTYTCQGAPRNEGAQCDDGDPFTLADACVEGVCLGARDRDLDGTPDALDCEPLDPALPDCDGKVCGDDGCGGSCGQCPQQGSCFDFACLCRFATTTLEGLEDVIVYGAHPVEDDIIVTGTFDVSEAGTPKTFVARLNQALEPVWLRFPFEEIEGRHFGIEVVPHPTSEGVLVHVLVSQSSEAHFFHFGLDGTLIGSELLVTEGFFFPYHIETLPGQGLVMSGTNDSKPFAARFDEELNLVWEFVPEGEGDVVVFDVFALDEGGRALVVGAGSRRLLAVLLDAQGQAIETYDRQSELDLKPLAVFPEPDGGFSILSLANGDQEASSPQNPQTLRSNLTLTTLDAQLNVVEERSSVVKADFFLSIFGDRGAFRLDNGDVVAVVGDEALVRFSPDMEEVRRYQVEERSYIFPWVEAGGVFTSSYFGSEEARLNLVALTGASGCACGDGVCDEDLDEDCQSCPADCGCGEGRCLGQGAGCCVVGDERCDGTDGDCDGFIDALGELNQCVPVPYFCDLDGDGLVGVDVTGSCDAFDCIPANCTTEAGQDEDDALNPARTCAEILAQNPGATDGLYGVDADGDLQTAPVRVFCLMEGDDAGWALVMKTLDNHELGYDSAYWTTPALFRGESLNLAPASAKLEAFNAVPFTTIRGCVAGPVESCVEHTFAEGFDSALALFSGPYVPIEGEEAERFRLRLEEIFGPEDYEDCPPQLPGFNAFDDNNNGNAARWGFFNNVNGQECQPNPEQDSDGAIGWGIQINGYRPHSAGMVDFGTSTNTAGFSTWLWVR